MRGTKKQQGVALITVILIVSIVTVIASAMAYRQNLEIRRTANVIDYQQAYLYALSAEVFAQQGLSEDRKANDQDDPSELIFLPITYEVEGGSINGFVEDLDRRLNLNNLLDADGKPSPVDIQRMQRLFSLQGVDPELVSAIVDWLDSDNDPQGFVGGEENDYLVLEPPYRTANGKINSVSELSLIKGFAASDEATRENFSKIAPFVSALPGRSKINVQTAPAEVLAALFQDLTVADAQTIQGGSYDKIDDFLNEDILSGRLLAGELADNSNRQQVEDSLALSSEYFLLNASILFGGGRVQLYSVMKRDEQAKVDVIMRSQGVY